MSYDIEYDSGDANYRMVIIRLHGYSSHRCGYVSVPQGHPFSGEDYDYEIPYDCLSAKINSSDPIGTLIAAAKAAKDNTKMEISYAAGVHGGITYAGGDKGYPLKDVIGSWWFGFDAGHCDDNDDGGRSLEFMKTECLNLREFLKKYDGKIKLVA